MIRARESPEFLPRGIFDAEQRMPTVKSPAIAMTVDRQLTAPAKFRERRQSDAMQTHHHTRALGSHDRVVMAQHRFKVIRDIEGEHDFLSSAFGELANNAHHGA